MKFERVCRFRMNMSGYGVAVSGLFMGVYFFLHVLYYFGFGDVVSMDKNALWMNIILPLGVSGLFFALLRGVQINVPVIYAVLGLFLCGLMVFSEGASALDIIWLVIALAALFVVFFGYITIRSIACVVFLVPFLLRLKDAVDAFNSISLDTIIDFMPEAWCLCLLLAMVFLPRGLEREELSKSAE